MLAYQPVRALSTLNIGLQEGLSAASRILPIIDTKNEINDSENAKDLEINEAKIQFDKIKFSYDTKENKVLNEVNLEFRGGKMTSLVGHSGAGKSTILNLIPRFFDAKSGDILIDGQSIYKTKIKSLRSHISLVSQETTLFDDTIKKILNMQKMMLPMMR